MFLSIVNQKQSIMKPQQILLISGLLTFFSLHSMAQPVLEEVEDYKVGEKAVYLNVEPPSVAEGASGSDVTWDFSNLNPNDSLINEIVHPDSTPYRGKFPNADVAEKNGEGLYVFQEVGNGNNQVWGVTDQDVVFEYNNPYQAIFRPITYQDSLMDTARRSYQTQGFSYEGTGFTKTKVDGWGTLKLPNGTYTNVLRIRLEQLYKDTAQASGSITTTKIITYTWFNDEYKSPILSIDSTAISSQFFNDTSKTVRYLDKETTTSQQSYLRGKKGINGYLHRNQLHISFPFKGGEKVEVKILNLSGQVTDNQQIQNHGQKDVMTIDLQGQLPKGIKIIQMMVSDNNQKYPMVIKEF